MEKNYMGKTNFRKYFYLAFSLAFIIAFIILFTVSVNKRKDAFEKLEVKENSIVSLESDKISRELVNVLSDLKYLHNAFKDDLIDPLDLSDVANNWKEFSNQRCIYDQIRFIDIDGNERIRINKNDEKSYIVADEDLQNKADRYYFQKSIELNEGDFYISPLDLNIEGEEVEIPYKPVIRLSTPLYDDNGIKKGIIIINYLASDLLSLIRTVGVSSEGSLSLLNSYSFYLYNEDENKEWGFMFEKSQNVNFKNTYKSEWQEISHGKSQVLSDNGIFFSNKLDLHDVFVGDASSNVVIEKSCWFIVVHVPRNNSTAYYFTDNKSAMLLDIIKSNIFTFIFAIIFSLLVGTIVLFNNKYYSKIRYFSQYDSLTNAYNRGYGLSQLEKVLRNDNKKSYPLCLCYIDINGLKEVNDNLGHKEGSRLIRFVVKRVLDTIAKDDFIIRLGGDEFLIVLKGKNENQAELIWKSIVDKYNKINDVENFGFLISVSHGIIELEKDDKSKTHDVLHKVDKIMYVEKKLIKSKLITVLK